jgi:phospholipase/carboxylesterase
MNAASLQTPILLAHGLFDPVVPLQLGVTTKEQLNSLGFSVNWHTYPMQHTIAPEEIEHIKDFVQRVLQ